LNVGGIIFGVARLGGVDRVRRIAERLKTFRLKSVRRNRFNLSETREIRDVEAQHPRKAVPLHGSR
jgi:hypothetical protein